LYTRQEQGGARKGSRVCHTTATATTATTRTRTRTTTTTTALGQQYLGAEKVSSATLTGAKLYNIGTSCRYKCAYQETNMQLHLMLPRSSFSTRKISGTCAAGCCRHHWV